MFIILKFSTEYYLTSDYCTATLSHVNLVVTNNAMAWADYKIQYRAPNKPWTDYSSSNKDGSVYGKNSDTFNINAIKGYDYRVKIISGRYTNGVVTCW
ncbi:hypothetical protein AMS60_01870 [Bacillus sp. FJAT-21945]|nr:hypothetical protein AMS60_01870 [Bacillus sp. FJAT-21945]